MLTQQAFGPVRQGDTFRVNFVLQDANGAPLRFTDLEGATLTWRSSLTMGGESASEVAAALVDGGDGSAVAQVLVPTDQAGFFFHELEMVLTGDTTTMATGWFSIEPEITTPVPVP